MLFDINQLVKNPTTGVEGKITGIQFVVEDAEGNNHFCSEQDLVELREPEDVWIDVALKAYEQIEEDQLPLTTDERRSLERDLTRMLDTAGIANYDLRLHKTIEAAIATFQRCN